MRQTSFGFCLSLDLSTKSGALKYISWKKETKADRPLFDRGIVKESPIADQRITTGISAIFKHRSYRERISSSLSRNLSLLIKESSRNLSFAEWGISAYIVKESPLPDGGISACYSKNHRWISAIGKESQLTDQRIIQESRRSARNLSLLIKESSRNLCFYRQGISSCLPRNLHLLIKESSSNLSLLMEGRKNHPGISSCGSRISRNLSLLLTEESSTCRWRNLLIKESLHNTHSSTFVFFVFVFFFFGPISFFKNFHKFLHQNFS